MGRQDRSVETEASRQKRRDSGRQQLRLGDRKDRTDRTDEGISAYRKDKGISVLHPSDAFRSFRSKRAPALTSNLRRRASYSRTTLMAFSTAAPSLDVKAMVRLSVTFTFLISWTIGSPPSWTGLSSTFSSATAPFSWTSNVVASLASPALAKCNYTVNVVGASPFPRSGNEISSSPAAHEV